MFGKWQGSLLNLDSDVHNRLDDLYKDPNIRSLGVSRFIGRSEEFGNVMTFNDEMPDLGNFKLTQGSMPKDKDEIVLEYNQLSYCPNEVKPGDTVDLAIEITLFDLDESEAVETLRERYLESLDLDENFFQEYYEESKDIIDRTVNNGLFCCREKHRNITGSPFKRN